MKEADLYLPVKHLFEKQGYAVKGEVQGCDVLAVRGDEAIVVVELKRSLNLTVVLQAVDRLALTTSVYIGVPEACTALRRKRKRILKMLRMLGLGLLTVDAPSARVTVVLDPGTYKPRVSAAKKGRLLAEFQKRVGDPNLGGSAMTRGVMTAYRQQALGIADFLQNHGPAKASVIAKALAEPKARNILYRNVYGWFDRVSTGIYALSPRGRQEVPAWLGDSDGTDS